MSPFDVDFNATDFLIAGGGVAHAKYAVMLAIARRHFKRAPESETNERKDFPQSRLEGRGGGGKA